jgi:DNA polymerase III alpha subunit
MVLNGQKKLLNTAAILWYLQTFHEMRTDKFGQMIFGEQDVMNLYLQGHDLAVLNHLLVDNSIDLETAAHILDHVPQFVQYDELAQQQSVEQWDHRCQANWYMPEEYKQLDIAAYVLTLCESDAELQRCGQELMMFQERDLFNLLRYLKYLVDTMTQNRLIWGVGRGSSVASFVLYKLGVHRINSLHYELDPAEFLR